MAGLRGSAAPPSALERTKAFEWLMMALYVGTFFGGVLTVNDAVPAKAYRSAPVCGAGQTAEYCRGVRDMAVVAVRTPAGGGQSLDVAFTTGGDSSVATVRLDQVVGLTEAIKQAQSSGVLLPVRVWGHKALAVRVDGRWYWAWGDPPDGRNAATALSVAAGLLLVVNRVRVRLRHRRRKRWAWTWLRDDAGQTLAVAGSVWFMAIGYGWAAVSLVAGLAWSVWTVGMAADRSSDGRPRPGPRCGTVSAS